MGWREQERAGEMEVCERVCSRTQLSNASRQMHPDRGGETEMTELSVQ